MHDVVTMGSATMDVFVETEKNTAVIEQVDGKDQPFITYRSGEKILIKHLQFEVGGGGTNTAVCFARLGLHSAYLGNIGTDTNGKQVIELLKSEHVDFIGSTSSDLTNYSIVLESTLLHDRTILVYKGASEKLLASNIPKVLAKWLYVSSLADESFRTAKRVMEQSRHDNTKIACNPSNYQIENNKDDVLAMIQLSDVIILNREEAALLVGDGTEIEMSRRIHALGPTIVAITLGSKGVVVSDGTQILRAYPTPNIVVRETTGAGDCFASSFVAALMYNKSLDEALRWGMCNVESHIAHVGAKAGLLTKSELQFAVLSDSRAILDG